MNKYLAPFVICYLPAAGDTSSSGAGVGQEAAASPANENIYGSDDSQGDVTGPAGKKEVPSKDSSKGKNNEPAEETPADEPQEDFSDKGKDEGDAEDFSDKTEDGEEVAENLEGEDGAEGTEDAGTEEETTPEKQPTLAELVAEIKKSNALAQAPADKNKPTLPSREEMKKLLNPVEVTADTLREMGFENASPEQVAGFQKFASATVTNAVSIAKVMLQREVEKHQATLAPLFQAHEAKAEAETRNSFYKQFPSLQKYDKIMRAAATEIANDPASASLTGQQVYKRVAALTVKTLGELGIKVDQSSGKTPATHSAGAPVKKVPVAPKPGASGRSGGAPESKGKPNNPDAAIY